MGAGRKVLLEGRPGIGKTTVVRRFLELLSERGRTARGFLTEEIRREGRRVGFRIESVAGGGAVLAHVELPGPPRVGRYGVDLPAFERIALPELAGAEDLLVLDELGKMELASEPFRRAVREVFGRGETVLATVQLAAHPLTDALKRSPDTEVIRVEEGNRADLPARLLALLLDP